MNQKHMDSISLEVHLGLKIKGKKMCGVGYVSKAKWLKTMQATLQNRKHAFLLETRATAADQKASWFATFSLLYYARGKNQLHDNTVSTV